MYTRVLNAKRIKYSKIPSIIQFYRAIRNKILREYSKHVNEDPNLSKKIDSTDSLPYNRSFLLSKLGHLKGASCGTLPVADTEDPSLQGCYKLQKEEGLICIKIS